MCECARVFEGGELLALCEPFSSLVVLFLEVPFLFMGGGVRKLETDPPRAKVSQTAHVHLCQSRTNSSLMT